MSIKVLKIGDTITNPTGGPDWAGTIVVTIGSSLDWRIQPDGSASIAMAPDYYDSETAFDDLKNRIAGVDAFMQGFVISLTVVQMKGATLRDDLYQGLKTALETIYTTVTIINDPA